MSKTKRVLLLAFFVVAGVGQINLSHNGDLSFGPSHVFATGDGGDGGGDGDGGGGAYVPYNPVCTNGATNYPYCNNNHCTNGATNFPQCNNNVCTNGATNYPSCNNNVCTNGATNYPSCNNVCTNGYTNYPTCGPTTCTNGATNFPACNNVCTNGYSNYPTCGPTTCSNGATNFPYCNNNVCTNGATNYPSCNNNVCTNGATNYPHCNNVCTNGYSNYPTCGPTTCSNGATNFPYCNNNVCTNGATNYPSCNNVCTNGYSNYPTCGPTTCSNGATNFPSCNNNVCTNGATNYPYCNNNNVCTNGYSNYPTCGPTTCSNGATNFPYCNNNTCSNGATNYPTCTFNYCTNGYSNYPTCGPTYVPPVTYVWCNGRQYVAPYSCPIYVPPQISCPTVSTTGATGGYTTATIYGYVNPNNNNSSISFDYGTNPNGLQWKTTTQSTSYAGQFSAQLSGLTCGTRYYYRASAQGASCSPTGNTLSFVTQSCQQTTYDTSSVITRLATAVGYYSAQFNGSFITSTVGDKSCQAFFDYGTNYNLTKRTLGQSLYNGSTVNYFSKAVSGLSPNTTYFYRAGITCLGSTKYGNIVSFKTPAIIYVKKKIVTTNYIKPVTTVSNTATCLCDKEEYISLLVENMEDVALIGKTANYKISFKNTSKETIRDIAIRVVLPEEETIYSASAGQFTKGGKTYLLTIPQLSATEEGAIILTVSVDSTVTSGKQMVVNAYANYTVPTVVKAGVPLKGEVTAYALSVAGVTSAVSNNGNVNSPTTANTVNATWLPSNFFEWIIAILVFIIFISALRYVFTAFRSTSN